MKGVAVIQIGRAFHRLPRLLRLSPPPRRKLSARGDWRYFANEHHGDDHADQEVGVDQAGEQVSSGCIISGNLNGRA